MASTSFVGVLRARWRVTATGVLLTLVLAAVAFFYFPVQYASSATAVLVPPKSLINNPMLAFDASVNTTALVLVQELGSPEVGNKLGIPPPRMSILNPRQDIYTVQNIGSVDLRDDGIDRPFVTITSLSVAPDRSEAIVGQVLNEAIRELKDRQTSMHVPQARLMQIQTVVGPVPAKVAPATTLKAIGFALALGLAGTVLAARMVDRIARRRKPDAEPQVLPRADRPAEVQFVKASLPVGPDAVSNNGRPVGFDRIV
jgi:hypothetical protein